MPTLLELIRLLEIAGEAYFAQDYIGKKIGGQGEQPGGVPLPPPGCDPDLMDELCELEIDEYLFS